MEVNSIPELNRPTPGQEVTLLFCAELLHDSMNFKEVLPFLAAIPKWVTAF